jgi:hypothetical protein
MIGASQSALSIQNPSQSGPRTHADERFLTHGAAVPISITAAGEESSAIRALPSAPLAHLDPIIIDAISLSLELHGEATASRVDSKALLCRGNADYHTGLI